MMIVNMDACGKLWRWVSMVYSKGNSRDQKIIKKNKEKMMVGRKEMIECKEDDSMVDGCCGDV